MVKFLALAFLFASLQNTANAGLCEDAGVRQVNYRTDINAEFKTYPCTEALLKINGLGDFLVQFQDILLKTKGVTGENVSDLYSRKLVLELSEDASLFAASSREYIDLHIQIKDGKFVFNEFALIHELTHSILYSDRYQNIGSKLDAQLDFLVEAIPDMVAMTVLPEVIKSPLGYPRISGWQKLDYNADGYTFSKKYELFDYIDALKKENLIAHAGYLKRNQDYIDAMNKISVPEGKFGEAHFPYASSYALGMPVINTFLNFCGETCKKTWFQTLISELMSGIEKQPLQNITCRLNLFSENAQTFQVKRYYSAVVKSLKKTYGLDDGMWEQYLSEKNFEKLSDFENYKITLSLKYALINKLSSEQRQYYNEQCPMTSLTSKCDVKCDF